MTDAARMPIVLQELLRALFYAPFYVALAQGWLRGGGRRSSFRLSAPRPGDAAQGLFDGSVDVCWGGPMRVMETYDQAPDCDLVSFAEVVTRTRFSVGRAPRPAFSLGDLPGLRVGTVSEVPTPWMCLQEDLRRAGVAPASLDRVADRTMAETPPPCGAAIWMWCRCSNRSPRP